MQQPRTGVSTLGLEHRLTTPPAPPKTEAEELRDQIAALEARLSSE